MRSSRAAVVFVLIVIVMALGVSAISAQTGYGSPSPAVPACNNTASLFNRLSDADAVAFVTNLPAPTDDADLVAVYLSVCFGNNIIDLNNLFNDQEGDFSDQCDNLVAYRVEVNGNRERWPLTCDSTQTFVTIPGTNSRGHILVYTVGDQTAAPAGVTLSRGA